jgi:hypothetical protein
MIVRIIIGRSRTEKTDTLAKEPMDLAKFNGNIFVRRRLVNVRAKSKLLYNYNDVQAAKIAPL